MLRKGMMMTAMAAIIGLGFGVFAADDNLKWGENDRLKWGGDIRIRNTYVNRATIFPNGVPAAARGPAMQWIRVRERLWMSYKINDDMDFYMRLGNRWHHTLSHPRDPNNQKNTQALNTWQFPDEVYIDQLKLTIRNVFDREPLSLTIGRQDVILGNGMVVLEGTPFDQGRSIYFDGIRATWKDDCDKIDVFGFYSDRKDTWPTLNDQNRQLRRGDTFLGGVYWTHNFKPSFMTDMYYIYNQITPDRVLGDDVKLHVFGSRAFGQATELMDYSLEAAMQRGELQNANADMRGFMVDARLGYKLPTDSTLQPKLNLQYTFLSGDDQTRTAYTGWHPVAAEYPIWREELIPIMNGANWTNASLWRLESKMKLADNVCWTAAAAHLRADTTSGTASSGKTMGNLFSNFIDWNVTKNWDMKFEAAWFEPNSFFANDKPAKWFRIENVFRF